MKLRGSTIIEVMEALPRLADHFIMNGMAEKAFEVAKLRQGMHLEATTIFDIRNALAAKYGEQRGNQRTILFGTPEYDQYVEEFTPVVQREYDLPIEPLRVTSKDIHGINGGVFLATSSILILDGA